jgi:predicted ATPase
MALHDMQAYPENGQLQHFISFLGYHHGTVEKGNSPIRAMCLIIYFACKELTAKGV